MTGWTYADELGAAIEEEREYLEEGWLPDWWTTAEAMAVERYRARRDAFLKWEANYTHEASP